MENAKNLILSLKFPFSLVKENRFIMNAPGAAPAEGGGAVDKDKDAKAKGLKESPEDKRTRENIERSAEIDKELDTLSKDSNIKEAQLAKVAEDFQKIPVPVDPDNSEEMVRYEGKTGFEEARQKYAQDKPAYDLKKAAYDKQVAAIRLELMAINSKRIALTQEMKALNAYKDPRVESVVSAMNMDALKDELDAGKTKFLDGLLGRLDAAKIAERRDKYQINADKWDITSKPGLAAVKKDFMSLQVYENTPFFNNVFDQLARLSDPKELEELKPGEEKMYSSIEDKKNAYLNPEVNGKVNNRIGDKALASAVSFFISIKDLLKQQDNLAMAADERVQGKDQDKIASTGIKFVTDNIKKFQDAIKQKDWGTAAVYVLCGYAAYKGAMKIWEKTPDLAKKGIYAAGFLYAVNMFSKNAGYDIGKKLGLTAAEDEVRGTSLAYLYGLNKVPESKDMDGRVLLDIGGTSVADLNSLYLESNEGGIKSIDPNSISPSPFPQFRGMTPNLLRKTEHLTSKEEEYQRVGRELYKIAKVVVASYDQYIKPKNGLTLGQALNSDPNLKGVSLFNFAMLFKDVAIMGKDRFAGGILGETLGLNLASYNMRKQFNKVFQDKQMDFEAVHTPIERGVYKAQVMNFPIVIREDAVNKEYIVFSLDDYKKANGNPNAATQALCKIPFEGNADAQAQVLKDAVVDRFKKVVEALNKSAKESLNLGEVKYEGGKFVSTLKVEKGSMLGKEETIPVILKVSKDGSTVEVYRQSNEELIINLDSSGDRTKLLGNLVMAGLAQQDNMKPFFFLYKAKKMEFKGKNMDDSFDVSAGDSKVLIKFKLNKATGKYEFAEKGAEAKLFDGKNYGFLRELAENSVRENKDWKKNVESFANVLEGMPEGYMFNLFKNAPNWWKDATSDRWFRGFKLEQFTGSIPKNYTNAMVDAQAEFLISGMIDGLAGSKNLADASSVIKKDDDIKAATLKLDRLTMKLSNIKKQNAIDGKDITSEEFKKDILDSAAKLAVKSNTYSLWYARFSTAIFMDYGRDGIIPGQVNKGAKIVSVYAAYTHNLDDKRLDGKTVSDPLYVKYATYSNYVTERMYRKLNEWAGTKPVAGELLINIPDRGPDWEIDDFETFDNNWATPAKRDKYKSVGVMVKNEEGDEEKAEMSAEMDAFKMERNYTTFDEYVDPVRDSKADKLKKAIEKTQVDIAALDSDKPGYDAKLERLNKKLDALKDKIILPRENCRLVIRTAEDRAMYLDLIKNVPLKNGEHMMKPTQLENQYFTKIQKAFDRVEKEYKKDIKQTEFNELRYDFYTLKAKNKSVTPAATLPYTTDFEFEDDNSFYTDVSAMEQSLKALGRPITKSDQTKLVDKFVKEAIEKTLLDDSTFYDYFEKTTKIEKVQEFFTKTWDWILS